MAARERETWPKPAPKVPERCNKGPPASVAGAAQHSSTAAAQQSSRATRIAAAVLHTIIEIAQSVASHVVEQFPPGIYCILLHQLALGLNKMLHHMLFPPFIASACIGLAPLIASTCIANHPIAPDRCS